MTVNIRNLNTDDLPLLEKLFAAFPHKRFQHRSQGVKPDLLAQLFTAAEERSLATDKTGETWQWVVDRDGAPVAFAALHNDAWHSRFFPYRCARIAPFLTYAVGMEERVALLRTILDQAASEGFDHLSVRVDNAEFAVARLLVDHGFYLVDASVKLSARLDEMPLDLVVDADVNIRRFEPRDMEAVRRIATESHPENHYYNDPHLPRENTHRLFTAWVDRCCEGFASDVFVLDRGHGAEGFVIYLEPKAVNNFLGIRLVVLDFVCLAGEARGQGLGRQLICQTLRTLTDRFDMVELRTSQTNFPALSCYQSLAMRPISGDFILHGYAEHGLKTS